MLLENLLKRK